MLGADVGDDLVDVAAALGFELDGDVAGVGLGDGGEAHLEAGAAGDVLSTSGCSFRICSTCVEDAVGFGERAAGGMM